MMEKLCLLACAAFVVAAAPPVRIIDGDTFELPTTEIIRIKDLDAPEMGGRAKCDRERQLAVRAKDELQRLVNTGEMTLRRDARKDRYGRTVAVVMINGLDVNGPMIASGYARHWNGKASDWCRP